MLEMQRLDFERNKGKYASRVRANINKALRAYSTDAAGSRNESAREFFAEEVDMGNMRTLAFLTFGVATAFDQMQAGEWVEAEDTLARLLVGSEQCSLDDSKWQLAWLLTHLPDPPWHRIAGRKHREQTKPFAKLSDPAWVAAAIAYTKDVAALQELHKKTSKGGGKGEDAQ